MEAMGFERIKQYAAKEQAELRVRIQVPGSWPGFHNLTAEERREPYTAEAFEHVAAHRFAKQGSRPAQTCEGIKFLCEADVIEDPQHAGFIMPLTDWNRYRHDTYKGDRDKELPYIRTPNQGEGAGAPPPAAAAEPERPPIYSEFDFVSAGVHKVKPKDGSAEKTAKCEFWLCKNTSGNCKHRIPIKVVNRATGKLNGHLKVPSQASIACSCQLITSAIHHTHTNSFVHILYLGTGREFGRRSEDGTRDLSPRPEAGTGRDWRPQPAAEGRDRPGLGLGSLAGLGLESPAEG